MSVIVAFRSVRRERRVRSCYVIPSLRARQNQPRLNQKVSSTNTPMIIMKAYW
jgi:hypothetical protein